MRLGARLKQLRQAKGLTQVALAKRLKVTQGYLSQLEGGYEKEPTLTVLRKLARVLQVDLAELLK
jgi:XRE family transcriptional regulator, master regulator for biofilm formation